MAESRALAHVIVGGGVAGATAAQALREAGETGPVTLIGAEAERPYERPELSKGFLAGNKSRADLAVHDDDWYAANDVELRLGVTASAIDRSRQVVELDDGGSVPYDRLLLATGSAPLPLPVPGGDLSGVLSLRTVADSEAISAALAASGPLVVIGGGWIGLEVAAVARSRGLTVTVLEAAPHVLQRALGGDVGVRLAALHRRHGVDVRTGVQVAAVLGDGAVEAVELESGDRIEASAVIAGVGIRPRTALAEAAGLEVDNGVVVDAALRTSDRAIWAAGDVANAQNDWVGSRLRVEHFANANDQGPFVGRSMALSDRGDDAFEQRWNKPPYFWSDQYDVGLEYRGWADPSSARLVLREAGADDPWFAFWLDDAGRVAAALHVNGWDDADTVKDLVLRRAAVAPLRLADGAVPLTDVTSSS
jgi:3-phenylpropionate/trans-cinnamate dioxygenase ferredoxin reductase subunit